MQRIDTHQHLIPPDYRKALQKAGIDDPGGRALPDWSTDAALQTASHRMAAAILAETGRNPADTLDDFAGFYFDTALSSSAAALPTLLAFAKPGHITFGSRSTGPMRSRCSRGSRTRLRTPLRAVP